MTMTFSMPPLPPPAAPSPPPTREEIFAEYRRVAAARAEKANPPGLRERRWCLGEDFVGERIEHDDLRESFERVLGPCPFIDHEAKNREVWEDLDRAYCKAFEARLIELHGPAGTDIVDHDGSKWFLPDTTEIRVLPRGIELLGSVWTLQEMHEGRCETTTLGEAWRHLPASLWRRHVDVWRPFRLDPPARPR